MSHWGETWPETDRFSLRRNWITQKKRLTEAVSPTLLRLVLYFIEFDPFDPHNIIFHKSGCSVDGFNCGFELLWLVSLSEREQVSENFCHSELITHEDNRVTIAQTLTV